MEFFKQNKLTILNTINDLHSNLDELIKSLEIPGKFDKTVQTELGELTIYLSEEYETPAVRGRLKTSIDDPLYINNVAYSDVQLTFGDRSMYGGKYCFARLTRYGFGSPTEAAGNQVKEKLKAVMSEAFDEFVKVYPEWQELQKLYALKSELARARYGVEKV